MSALLEWAMVVGAPRWAREFVGVEDRPDAKCPCCGSDVTWKAGDVVTPHVAHAPGSTCPTSNPETAAHLNGKANLVARLAARRDIKVYQVCERLHTTRMVWTLGPWVTAVPEYRVGTRRPDVALVDAAGAVVAAIEVKHTHAVDARKAADLAALNVPWIEVTAVDAGRWDGSYPLKSIQSDEATFGECRACVVAAATRREAEARARANEKARLIALAAARTTSDATDLRRAADREASRRIEAVAYAAARAREEADHKSYEERLEEQRRVVAAPEPRRWPELDAHAIEVTAHDIEVKALMRHPPELRADATGAETLSEAFARVSSFLGHGAVTIETDFYTVALQSMRVLYPGEADPGDLVARVRDSGSLVVYRQRAA